MFLHYTINALRKKYRIRPAGLELIQRYNGVTKVSNFSSRNSVRWFTDIFFFQASRVSVIRNPDKYPKHVVDFCIDPANSRVFTVWYFDANPVMKKGLKHRDQFLVDLNMKEKKKPMFLHI